MTVGVWTIDAGRGSSKITPLRKKGGRTPAQAVRAEHALSDLVAELSPMQEAEDLPDLWAGLARAVLRTIRVDACR
ncbi:MAG: hypothetical protein ABR575_11935, partial [Actinomycetota bacterium]